MRKRTKFTVNAQGVSFIRLRCNRQASDRWTSESVDSRGRVRESSTFADYESARRDAYQQIGLETESD